MTHFSRGGKGSPAATDLRVIAGKYKGTKLASPRNSATHPMGAREKNALFNMLQPWIADARVLDAYAGSGALGIEALSRGATSAAFVEQQPAVVRILHENLSRIGVAAEVLTEAVAAATERTDWQGKFNLIIADPPYDNFQLSEVEALGELLMSSGILALSYPGDLGELELTGFQLLTARHYAAAGIGIYQKTML